MYCRSLFLLGCAFAVLPLGLVEASPNPSVVERKPTAQTNQYRSLHYRSLIPGTLSKGKATLADWKRANDVEKRSFTVLFLANKKKRIASSDVEQLQAFIDETVSSIVGGIADENYLSEVLETNNLAETASGSMRLMSWIERN